NCARQFLDVHQLIKAKLAPGVVEEQIDIRIFARLIAGSRAKQKEALHAELLQLRFVLPQSGDGFAAPHGFGISLLRAVCHGRPPTDSHIHGRRQTKRDAPYSGLMSATAAILANCSAWLLMYAAVRSGERSVSSKKPSLLKLARTSSCEPTACSSADIRL